MKNRPLIKAGYIGILMLLFGIILMNIFPKNAHMAEGFKTPVIFFEFANNIQETQKFFGITDGQNIPDKHLIQQMNLGNKIDFIYAFVYALFLFLFARKIKQISKKKIFSGVMFLAISAFVSDVFENINLLQITSKITTGDFQHQLSMLHIFTWMKWGSLAIGFALLSKWFYDQKSWQRIIAPLCWMPVVLAGLSYYFRGANNEYFSLSVMSCFIILVIHSFVYSTRKKV